MTAFSILMEFYEDYGTVYEEGTAREILGFPNPKEWYNKWSGPKPPTQKRTLSFLKYQERIRRAPASEKSTMKIQKFYNPKKYPPKSIPKN